MKKIRIFLLILAAMFAVQIYEPVTSCDVYAAAKTITKKSTAKKKTKKKKNGFYKESSKKYCYYKNGKKFLYNTQSRIITRFFPLSGEINSIS